MQVIYIKDMSDIDTSEKVIALGFFDAVHLGHKRILEELKVRKGKLKTAILTFDYPYKSEDYLYDLNTRIDMYSEYDIDIIYVVIKESDFMNLEYDKFIEWLKSNNVKETLCGVDFRFGKGAKGSIDDLQKHFKVTITNDVNDQNDSRISTSSIIKELKEGNIKVANQMLGYNYFITGNVIKANQLGRIIGFPTVNIIGDNVVLAPGVYITETIIDNIEYKSLTNIGYNPTVSDDYTIKIETHILDFNRDIYGHHVEISFIDKLRDEIKFKTVDELKEQLINDKEKRKLWNI